MNEELKKLKQRLDSQESELADFRLWKASLERSSTIPLVIDQPEENLDNEFIMTKGHAHPRSPAIVPGKAGGAVVEARGYPEIYEVIYGKVFFMIQSATPDLEKLQEACVITVEKGEKAVIPPGFGHVMINASDDVAVTANWQPTANASDYSSYEKHNGAAYYVIESERLSADGKRTTKEPEFVPNLNYKEIPKLIHARPRELPQYNLRSAWPMYASAVQDPAKLDFLPHPANYLEELTPEKLFTNQK